MNSADLRKLQLVETEILKKFDAFCKEHGLKYSLYAGTALGAVRHGGFIPWDDDIDVCMTREDYDKFLKIYRENPIEGFYLQGTDDPNYEHINFSKLRKNGTKFGTEKDVQLYDHVGIFLDIFPFDKIPTDKKKRKKFLYNVKLWLVYTRGYAYTKGSKFLKLVSKLLLLKSRKRQLKIRNKLEKKILAYKSLENGYELASLSCPASIKNIFPANILDDVQEINFEDIKASIYKDYDTALRITFGDYMQLPPEEERVCKHEPYVFDIGE